MRRHVAVVGPIWALLTAALIALVVRVPILPAVASREGVVSDAAFMTLLVLSLPVFVLVQVVLGYSLLRFRARPADGDGPAIGGHRAIETVWLGVSLVLVLFLAWYGWRGLEEMRGAAAGAEHAAHFALADVVVPGELRVKVIGSQFAWRFDYPDLGVTSVELRVPKDRVVRFEITSLDVLHSFWVPAFRMKQDAVPGRTITVRVTPTEVGHYGAQCTALCGAGHTVMQAPVEVMEPEAFDAWVVQQRAAVKP